jgi:hypothetical protein
LTGLAAAEVKVTVETLLAKAEKVYARAFENGQLSAAVGAIPEMDVLGGVRVERKEVGPPGAFDDLSDDQLERVLVDHFNSLGLTPNADRRH